MENRKKPKMQHPWNVEKVNCIVRVCCCLRDIHALNQESTSDQTLDAAAVSDRCSLELSCFVDDPNHTEMDEDGSDDAVQMAVQKMSSSCGSAQPPPFHPTHCHTGRCEEEEGFKGQFRGLFTTAAVGHSLTCYSFFMTQQLTEVFPWDVIRPDAAMLEAEGGAPAPALGWLPQLNSKMQVQHPWTSLQTLPTFVSKLLNLSCPSTLSP
ncbi:hypothetical protein CRENBAI_010811 [Crenichthys baileyi]|uniref:Uncharacterized protein n=1 Tax=Crenichthys baileyi TaxID=28760 RepID=A0AAV9RMC4_9TELE